MFDFQMSHLVYFFLALFCFIYYMMKKITDKKERTPTIDDLCEEQLVCFLKQYGGNHLSHLIFLRDKQIYWAQENKVLIAYKKIANRLVVLGDPIGEQSSLHDAIKEFNDYCQKEGCKPPIFYQISPNFMHYYHETGYRFLKLGEEGLLNLDRFSFTGKQWGKLRTRYNKFARNNYTFTVEKPPFSNKLICDLKHISNSWLGTQKEKGFSVVSFQEKYISSFPVALLKNEKDEIIAFATLATDYGDTISIDLMRKLPESPHGTMDVLFIHIFKWAKSNHYKACSLGMAPLANVGSHQYSFFNEKCIRLAFLYGNSFYKFKGLKAFKSKFACHWEPKYLAYKKAFLPITIIQLSLLINKNQKPLNIVRKHSEKMMYAFKKIDS